MTDTELIEFTHEFREGILDGRASTWMCALVCWPLEGLLRFNGIAATARITEDIRLPDGGTCNHIWLELADGRVLDPTCDQFGAYPPVYLGPPLPTIHQVYR